MTDVSDISVVSVIADTIIKGYRIVIVWGSNQAENPDDYHAYSSNDPELMRGPVQNMYGLEPRHVGDAEGMIRYLAHAGTDRDAWKY